MDSNSELLLDHFKNPRNSDKIATPDLSLSEKNTSCNDEVHYDLALKDGKITAVHFHGKGCVLSQGCASLLSELIIGKSVDELKTTPPENLHEIFSPSAYPSRLKCTQLGIKALEKICS
jgi:nitrogen fixation protein NifU and related proteins